VRLRHPDDVRTALTQIEEQVERRSLLGAELPARLELLDLVVSPRPDPSDLRAFDAERGIVLQPPDVDGVPDQDPELLERVQRSARAVGEGLQDAGDDALARETDNGAVPMVAAKRFQAAIVARLARVSEPNVLRTSHVGGDQGGNRTRGSMDKTVTQC
jgi:hypothetical protein